MLDYFGTWDEPTIGIKSRRHTDFYRSRQKRFLCFNPRGAVFVGIYAYMIKKTLNGRT